MKRSLILSLCAVALAALGVSAAQAAVNVALNLRYDDPADPNEGGSWTLVALDDDPNNSDGIVGLVSRYTDLAPAGTVNGSIGHDINGGALVVGTFGSQTEFVYGQDPNDGLVDGVGATGGPSDQGADPLNNSAWDNASVIATGSFGGSRPVIDPNSVSANVHLGGAITAAAIGLTNVRGDSLNTLGLESPLGSPNAGLQAGDANRNGTVDITDFGILQPNFNVPGVFGWDDGDFNDSGLVDITDFGLLQPNFNLSGVPPAISAIPEPGTSALVAFGLLVVLGTRRKR